MPTILALLALAVAVAALFVSLRKTQPQATPSDPAEISDEARKLRAEVAALQAENADALRHLAVVRYDAFGEMGGHLSWSLALVDDAGSGVLITSIHGRSEARTYAKPINEWRCDAQLSPEEEEAIQAARP